MKSLLLLLAGLATLITGCSTVGSRIEEKSAVFNTLDPQTQTRLKQSVISVGDAPDLVYIALGRPDRIREIATGKGSDLTWIYTMNWQEYEGSHFVGYRRQSYYDSRAKVWRISYEPVRAEIYRDRVEEYMRVIFHDGKVTAIEQTRR
jgi:hypothetical protein